MFTMRSLGETTGTAQPVDKPFTRLADRARPVGQQITKKEVAG